MKKQKLKELLWYNDTLEHMEPVYLLSKHSTYLDVALVYLPPGLSKAQGKEGSIFFVEFGGYIGTSQPYYITTDEYKGYIYLDKKNSIENIIENLKKLNKVKKTLTR